MRSQLFAAFNLLSAASASLVPASKVQPRALEYVVKPKVFIVSMFDPEADIWYGIPEFDLLALNITVPGFSPLFPDAHCTADGDVCQLVTGESEINAAATVSALVHSGRFDLTSTYFFVAGIGGVNPEVATICSVTFARYAIQVALQYEIDTRELPSNFSTGYVPQGSTSPSEYPQSIYGTEVFEVNQNLQKLAASFARNASLNDSAAAVTYRAKYATSDLYTAGTKAPSVIECDVATSDVYFSGKILGETFSNYTKLVTNGTGNYCTTAQEDNATLEVLVRAAATKLVDFSRIIIMRTASDFDRPWPGQEASVNLFDSSAQGAFEPAIQNIYLAGIKVVEGILDGWNSTFAAGVNASNYVGDIFGTLGGEADFGPATYSNAVTKRSLDYNASKWGVCGLFRSALDHQASATCPVRANLLAPYFVATPVTAHIAPKLQKLAVKLAEMEDVRDARLRSICGESIHGGAVDICEGDAVNLGDDLGGDFGSQVVRREVEGGAMFQATAQVSKRRA